MRTTTLTALTLALLAACSGGDKNTNQSATTATTDDASAYVTLTRRQMTTVGVATDTMEQRKIAGTVRATGRLGLDAQSRAEVSPLVGGVVNRVMVHEGDAVARGQVVTYIESTEVVQMQQRYIEACHDATAAADELRRQQTLAAAGAGVEKSLRRAETTHAVARANRDALGRQLRQIGLEPPADGARLATCYPVKAPIAGRVGKIGVSTGSYADMQTVVMTIVDNSRMHADLMVYERDVPSLHAGQDVDLVLTADRNVALHGTVYSVNSAFDTDTRAVRVHVALSTTDRTLVEGMAVTALIDVGARQVTAVPEGAVVSLDGRYYVFCVSDGEADDSPDAEVRFAPVEVVTGASALGYTEVTPVTDLPRHARIVTRGAFYLSSMLEGDNDDD